MSNHVDRRLSADYMQVIADTLRSHAHAWFIVFGSDALAEKLSVFTAAGVVERVRFGGRQTQAGAALKMLDIYANEFPVGGSQSVIEAMACGVPVVALRWSQAHAESAGAEAVGTPYAIETADMTAYRERLETWVVDADQRRAAGQALKRRAETLFSVKIYVSEVLGLAERMLGKKLEKQAVVMTQM